MKAGIPTLALRGSLNLHVSALKISGVVGRRESDHVHKKLYASTENS